MDLYTKQADAMTYDNLFAGTGVPVQTKGVTLAAAQGTLARGSVLAKLTKAIGAAVKNAGNSGSGIVNGVSLGADAKIGTYTLTCIGGGTPTKSAVAAAWAGNAANTGALTMKAVTPLGVNVKEGVYKVVCIEPASDAGAFQVFDPDGILIGVATVGVEFTSTHVQFTIADGATNFLAGEGFNITVTFTAAVPSNGGTFSVVGPDGAALANAVVGTPYEGAINFTINDGVTDFAVGDIFTIAVSAASGNYVLVNSAILDGRQTPDCILTDETATGGEGATDTVVAVAYSSGLFNRNALVFGGTDEAADHEDRLRELSIILKDNIA